MYRPRCAPNSGSVVAPSSARNTARRGVSARTTPGLWSPAQCPAADIRDGMAAAPKPLVLPARCQSRTLPSDNPIHQLSSPSKVNSTSSLLSPLKSPEKNVFEGRVVGPKPLVL